MADEGTPNKVGYCSPPKETQWKKGGPSPNPKGRPKKKEPSSHLDDIRKELERPVTVAVNGVRRKELPMAVLARRTMHRALEGNEKALERIDRWRKELDAAAQAKVDAPKVGVVVLREPARSVEAWHEEAGAYRVPINPLEDLPGYDKETNTLNGMPYGAGPARKSTPEEDD